MTEPITRRRVLYLHGYDPDGPEKYHSLFRYLVERACQLWQAKTEVGDLRIESSDLACWTVDTSGPNWRGHTRYEILRYDDAVRANLAEPIAVQIYRAIRWMLGDFVSGTTYRTARASWQYATSNFLFQLF